MDESHSNNKHFPCKLLKILCEDDKGPNQGNLSLTSLFIFFHYFYLYWNSYSVFWTSSFFFFFFLRLLSSNSSKQNHQKWFHVVQSTWRTFLLASPGCQTTSVVQHCARKFHFNPASTARFKNTLEYLFGWYLEKLHGFKMSAFPRQILQWSTNAQVST